MWTDEYREIVEFYYWEPQHIGRAGGVKRFKNADEMYAHVNAIEVSLNHIFNLFFSLFPLHFVTLVQADTSHTMMSSLELSRIEQEQQCVTQPDMFFEGEHSNIAIELKTKSKCSVSQIQKYVDFHESQSRAKPLTIIILAPTDRYEKIFNRSITSEADVLSLIVTKHTLRIRILTYQDFIDSIDDSRCNDTERKLLAGLRAYISARDDLGISPPILEQRKPR